MRPHRITLAVVSLTFAAACGSGAVAGSSPAPPPAATVTVTTSPPPAPPPPAPPPPATTVTAQPAPAPTVTVAPAPVIVPPLVAPPLVVPGVDPATVVTEFFTAVNAGDYPAAWTLGGDNLGESYAAFVQGFSTTAYDNLTLLGVQGDVVSARLDATQTDGSVRVYEGTYTVAGGAITVANVTRIS